MSERPSLYYLSPEGEPVPVLNDADRELYYAMWEDDTARVVRQTDVAMPGNRAHKYAVSTVFLGSDHSYTRVGPSVLWETMVFILPAGRKAKAEDFLDLYQDRYTSREDAERGHEEVVAALRAAIDTGIEPDDMSEALHEALD